MTTITTISQAPILPVWMLDELVHTFENGYRCSDPSCPCNEEEIEDFIVDEYPSEAQMNQMYQDRRRWLSEHL